MFKSGALDPDGAVLAITLAYPTGEVLVQGADGAELHGRHRKDAAQQEADLRALVAEAATASQRVVMSLAQFDYERTGIYIFLTYHAGEEQGISACREMRRPLDVHEASAAVTPLVVGDVAGRGARLSSLLQKFVVVAEEALHALDGNRDDDDGDEDGNGDAGAVAVTAVADVATVEPTHGELLAMIKVQEERDRASFAAAVAEWRSRP